MIRAKFTTVCGVTLSGVNRFSVLNLLRTKEVSGVNVGDGLLVLTEIWMKCQMWQSCGVWFVASSWAF